MDHGELGGNLSANGGGAEHTLTQFARNGIDIDIFAAQLQDDGGQIFCEVWERFNGCDFVSVRRAQEGQLGARRTLG